MSFWFLLMMVIIAGAIGGLVGSFVNGRPVAAFGNWPIIIVNTFIGVVAASVSWLLYGPLSQAQIGATSGITITASTLGGAVLVGMVGSAWLTKAVGQNLFQKAAFNAAVAEPSLELATRMMNEGPASALAAAKITPKEAATTIRAITKWAAIRAGNKSNNYLNGHRRLWQRSRIKLVFEYKCGSQM